MASLETFLILIRDDLGWSRPRVQIAKAAITGEYVTQTVARLECGPVHTALSGINYRAPRASPKARLGEVPNAVAAARAATPANFAEVFATTVLTWFSYFFQNKHRNGK
jgi:hypothetical protein